MEKENCAAQAVMEIIDNTLEQAAIEIECGRPDITKELIDTVREFIKDFENDLRKKCFSETADDPDL